jgi:hypothetical protein
MQVTGTESRIFTISICEQMNSASGLVCVDPMYFQTRLQGRNMPDFFADMPLIIHQELHFMHDGAPQISISLPTSTCTESFLIGG